MACLGFEGTKIARLREGGLLDIPRDEGRERNRLKEDDLPWGSGSGWSEERCLRMRMEDDESCRATVRKKDAG